MHRFRRNPAVVLAASLLANGCGEPAAPRATLSLSPDNIVLAVCEEGPLTVTITPPGAGTPLFRSNDPTTATVSPTGVVKPLKAGVAWIHAWLATDTTVRDSTHLSVARTEACGGGAGRL